MTTSDWYAVNLFTGEKGPAIEPPHKPRRSDAVFSAALKLWGYEGAVLTPSLRGKCNKTASEIKQAEREADDAITLEEIAALLPGFGTWFKKYRRERFNETCSRCPYPMETAVLWPEYRKADTTTHINERVSYAMQVNTPGTAAYRLAHRHDDEADID
jgi:hypothetical protein